MVSGNGLNFQNSVAEAFRLFPDEAAGLHATRQYPATRLYRLRISDNHSVMWFLHINDFAIKGFEIVEEQPVC